MPVNELGGCFSRPVSVTVPGLDVMWMIIDSRINGPLLFLILASLGVSCSGQNSAMPAGSAPAPGQESATPSAAVPMWPPAGQVTFPSGRVFSVDLALTLEQQRRGYMGRKVIAPDEGLLFLYNRPGIRSFWMKNCLTDLDIIWLDTEDRVLYIEHSAPPCRSAPCPSYGPAQPALNILEIAGGTAAREGLRTGDRLLIVTDLDRP